MVQQKKGVTLIKTMGDDGCDNADDDVVVGSDHDYIVAFVCGVLRFLVFVARVGLKQCGNIRRCSVPYDKGSSLLSIPTTCSACSIDAFAFHTTSRIGFS